MQDSPPPMTRAERRAALARPAEGVPDVAHRPHVYVPVAMALFSAALVWGAHADASVVAAVVALMSVVLSVGWPFLWQLSTVLGPMIAIAVAGLGGAVAIGLPMEPPYLRHVPVVVALSLLVMFAHQLLRKDGREGLVASLGATALGVTFVVLGLTFAPLAHSEVGIEVITIAVAASTVSALADLLVGVPAVRPWLLPLSMLLGGVGALVTNLLHAGLSPAHSILIGFVCAAVSHSVRRLLATFEDSITVRGQVTTAAASVLSVGVAAYVLALLLIL